LYRNPVHQGELLPDSDILHKLDFSGDFKKTDDLYLSEDETSAQSLLKQNSSALVKSEGIKFFDDTQVGYGATANRTDADVLLNLS